MGRCALLHSVSDVCVCLDVTDDREAGGPLDRSINIKSSHTDRPLPSPYPPKHTIHTYINQTKNKKTGTCPRRSTSSTSTPSTSAPRTAGGSPKMGASGSRRCVGIYTIIYICIYVCVYCPSSVYARMYVCARRSRHPPHTPTHQPKKYPQKTNRCSSTSTTSASAGKPTSLGST